MKVATKMTAKVTTEDLRFIGECFLNDLNIQSRLSKSSDSNKENTIARLTSLLIKSPHKKVVYTAFDGDHFHLMDDMRKCVLRHDRYPANPESILGYKNVVTKYNSKIEVLKDDLAILKHCDELWVFTENKVTPEGILDLPEGVQLEIAFFMRRQYNHPVKFIPISALFDQTKNSCIDLKMTYAELKAILKTHNRDEIIDLANSNFKVDKELKDHVFYITDPLDFKYSEWLRDHSINPLKEIALVPGLASKISDAHSRIEYVGNIIMSWSGIMNKLSRKAYYLNCFDKRRSSSLILEALKNSFIILHGQGNLIERSWREYNIPKCSQNSKWPLTQHEAKSITECL